MKSQVEKIKRKIEPILGRFGVVKAALFGSYVTGTAKKSSDIDLLVKMKRGKSLLDIVGLKIELEELLGKRVDIITYNSLHPLLKKNILDEQEIFYEEKS